MVHPSCQEEEASDAHCDVALLPTACLESCCSGTTRSCLALESPRVATPLCQPPSGPPRAAGLSCIRREKRYGKEEN
jgi:hypothetical protein